MSLTVLPLSVAVHLGLLSVDYLLSGSPDLTHRPKKHAQYNFGPPLPDLRPKEDVLEDAIFYGYDLGFRDADINQNNDLGAISKTNSNVESSMTVMGGGRGGFPPLQPSGIGLQSSVLPRMTGGYYDRPILIRIPRNLEPLPSKLRDNPMNLLYFHHFLNHTAKTSHRAKLLRQREPEMRIALWVQDIFPVLRLALGDREQIISNTSLATAIMLASLEIISPMAFGYEIPWQTHLNLARDLMRRRLADLRRTSYSLEEDRVCSFLWSWLAYLDVLGSLSGGTGSDPSRSWVLEYTVYNNVDDQYEIDCIMGFTTKCVQLLAQVSELARHCDMQRIRSDGQARPEWIPDTDCVRRAQKLERELMESMTQPSHPCRHVQNVEARDRQEMVLMNEAFHWAGLVHIHRRVFGKSSGHADVQGPVQRILSCMEYVRAGGTAETGFLFPMFTAGCNTLDEDQRSRILERFRSVEGNGMTQVHKARRLMERVWMTGQPWEPLLCTEFIG
ncbi:hypothetical protein CGCSCA4_v008439 [Colletotrichum siamense]|uniref:C6 zinc finger domain-containing protein n=1 Tax=Colletotrichum siamense TaxID=690259 RepID=A0A9P5ERA7_COLSI|nr:hypothetical protein CGCSCA4_v008439 [Colletotrichum siamense]KAF4858148.1 hypothetical protein CGCSCA2_v007593 [Colletotrichum siamense]